MTTFFCYCCGKHYRADGCKMCGGSACWWCLEWAYPCRHPQDEWCAHFHIGYAHCTHERGQVEHQVEVT